MPGASWPFTSYYPIQYVVGADGSNAASAANAFPTTFSTLTLGTVSITGNPAVTFNTATLGAVSIAGNPAVTFNTTTLGAVTFSTLTLGTVSITGNPAVTFNTTTLGAVTFSTLTLGTVSITGNPAVTFNTTILGAVTFPTLTLGTVSITGNPAVTFNTATLGTVSITGNPAVTFNTATLGRVGPAVSGVSSSVNSFPAGSAQSITGSSTTRRFILFQPHCETQGWIAFATAAASGAPAISVSGTSGKNGPYLRLSQGYVPGDSITVFCQSAASYTFIEG